MIIIDMLRSADRWLAAQVGRMAPRFTGPTHPPRPARFEQPWELDVDALRGVIRLGDDTPTRPSGIVTLTHAAYLRTGGRS